MGNFFYLKNYFLLHFSHEGPVWQVAWAHPKFGSILASCSYDGTVIIWQESKKPAIEATAFVLKSPNEEKNGSLWTKAKVHRIHESSGILLNYVLLF